MTAGEARRIVAERRSTGFPGQDAAEVRYKALEAGCLEQRLGAMDRHAEVPPDIERRARAL